MISILDSGAMIAYLGDEPGSDGVEKLLQDPASFCYAHSVNLCEVHYHYARSQDVPAARKMIDVLFADGVVAKADMDRAFWEFVADLKTRGRIALADCFCLALAQRLGGQVVTTDHHEFDPLVPLGICPIVFIR